MLWKLDAPKNSFTDVLPSFKFNAFFFSLVFLYLGFVDVEQ